jgi:hypothetical protein
MRRPELVPDCASCAALCCVATSFDACDAFAVDKAAGERCRHLRDDDRCAIHDDLVPRGFAGCAGYDCYGAGQRATRLFAASQDPVRRDLTFLVLCTIHELLWLLTEAAKLCPRSRGDLAEALAGEIDQLDRVARGPVAQVLAFEWEAASKSARSLLRRVGQALQKASPRRLVVPR